MDVVLDTNWLVEPHTFLKSVEGCTIDKVPVMKFKESGILAIKESNLWMLGGNHRRLAVIKHIKGLKKKKVQAEGAINTMTNGRTEEEIANMEPEALTEVKKAEDLVKMLGAKIESSGMWSVRVYDRGEWQCGTRRVCERKAKPMSF
jgi:hypothetical protein